MVASVLASPAGAYDTIPDTLAISAAKARVNQLQYQSAQVARQLATTVAGIKALKADIEEIDGLVDRSNEQVPRLQLRAFALDGIIHHDEDVLAERAVQVYMNHSNTDARTAAEVVNSADLVDAARTNLLVGRSQVVETGRIEVNTDLRAATLVRLSWVQDRRELLIGFRWSLGLRQAELKDRAAQLRDRLASLDEQTAAAAATVRRLEQEEAERQYRLELERLAEERANQDANGDGIPDGPNPSASVPPPPPQAESQRPVADGDAADLVPIEDLVCPIAGGATFSNDWGQPRSGWRFHSGTDLFAPGGTPNVAVASGVARQTSSPKGGTSVWLEADHGVHYYYAHLSGWAGEWPGGSRRVAQGEVIGYTGNTGNAAGGPTHTHFQVHPGGGGAVNPYSIVLSIC